MKHPLAKLIIAGMRHLDEAAPAQRADMLDAGAAVLADLEGGQELAERATETAAVIRSSELCQLQFRQLITHEEAP